MADIVAVEEKTRGIKQSTIAIVARATKFVIKDAITLQKSSGILGDIAKAKKEAETLRITFTAPLNQSLKSINEFFKKLTSPLDKATTIIKGKVREYYFQQEEKVRKAEKERLLAEAKREEEIKKAQEEGREAVVIETPAVPEVKAPEKTVKSVAGGSMTTKTHWVFEIVDEKLIPNEYRIVSEQLIREAIRNGARIISGVKIYEDKLVSVR